MDQQAILGEEPRKEHPVPVFESDFVGEAIDRLGSALRVSGIPELSTMRSKGVSEHALLERHVSKRLVVIDAKRLQRLVGAGLGFAPRSGDGSRKQPPLLAG
jgi:hypothetical protein